jgi:hypothetical protein
VQGMQGTTPFIRWGNGPAVILALLIGLAAAAVSAAPAFRLRPKRGNG